MERDSVNVSLFCNVLVEQNISSPHKLVPNPMLKNVFDFVEHLKSSHRLSRVPRRSLPVAVKVTNNFGQDIFDISVFFDLSIELNAKESKSFKFALPIPYLQSKNHEEVLLLDLEGLPKSRFKVDAVSYHYADGKQGEHYSGNLPYLINVSELTNQFGAFANQTQRETYFLLDNYSKEGVYARGWLLTVLNKALQEVNTDKFTHNGKVIRLKGIDLAKARSTIQVGIVSQIMMYIEDFVILLIANKTSDKNFYDYLDKKDGDRGDLGDMITDFLKNTDSTPYEDFLAMLCYVDVNSLSLTEETKSVIKKLIDQNVAEVRRFLHDIKKFRDTHTQLFRRYKHAGFAMYLGDRDSATYPHTDKKFDSLSWIFSGDDPMNDAIPIPYSDDVMAAYDIMTFTLQRMILDVVGNKLGCLNRGIDKLIPLEMYGPLDGLSETEIETINVINNGSYEKNPHRAHDHHFRFSPHVDKEKVRWYVELDEFLKRTKANMEMERRQNESRQNKDRED